MHKIAVSRNGSELHVAYMRWSKPSYRDNRYEHGRGRLGVQAYLDYLRVCSSEVLEQLDQRFMLLNLTE